MNGQAEILRIVYFQPEILYALTISTNDRNHDISPIAVNCQTVVNSQFRIQLFTKLDMTSTIFILCI